jgi:voltage-gated potassium channel
MRVPVPSEEPAREMTGTLDKLRELYEGGSPRAHAFRDGLFIFDITAILYVIVSSFLPGNETVEWINRLFGVLVLADLAARIAISPSRVRELIRPLTLAEIVAAISFLLPLGGGAFLRALRTLRLLRTYAFLERLRGASTWFRRNEEAVVAATNLAIFIFVMTGVVYDTQHWSNPHITNYADALYFTVTTLTTTGFGDITLPGTFGRMVSVLIMICGVTLFLRLAQVLFRPTRVRFECPSCGLMRHDHDAVHCKACGNLLHIPDEGAV